MDKEKPMRVLIACEESQEVCKAFRARGHEAYSCDILPCSGGHPEWHFEGDFRFKIYEQWDLLIAHPPCTFLCNSGVSWLKGNPQRWEDMMDGAAFFKMMLGFQHIERIAVENPIPHKHALSYMGRSYDQLVQPYQFGHPERKATCLWLKGLPKLIDTNNVKAEMEALPKNKAQRLHYLPPGPERKKTQK